MDEVIFSAETARNIRNASRPSDEHIKEAVRKELQEIMKQVNEAAKYGHVSISFLFRDYYPAWSKESKLVKDQIIAELEKLGYEVIIDHPHHIRWGAKPKVKSWWAFWK